MRTGRRQRRPRAAIVAIEIAVFVGLFAVVLVGVGIARERLDRMVGDLEEQVTLQVESRLGAGVRYGAIRPSALRALRVDDLVLFTEAGELLSARRMRVHYSLRRLLSTRSAVAAVTRVELTGVVADIHLPRDRGPLLAALGGLDSVASDGGAQAAALPWPLVIADARVAVTAGADRVELEDVALRLEPDRSADGGRLRLVDARARVRAALADVAGHATEVSTRIRADGSAGPAGARAAVQVADVRTTLGTLPARDLHAEWDGRTIRITTAEAQPLLALLIEPDTGALRLDLQAQDLRPTDLVRPAGPLADLLPWFETTVSGTATLGLGDGDAVAYDASLRFAAPPQAFAELLDGPVEVALTVRGDAATAAFAPLAARAAAGAARFDGTIDIAARRAAGTLTVSDVVVDGRPVQASARVDADLPLSRLRLTLRDGELRFGGVTVAAVNGRVDRAERPANAGAPSSFVVDLTGSLPASPPASAALAGSVTLGGRPAFAGHARFEELSAGVLYRLLTPADRHDPYAIAVADGVVVTAEMTGSAGPELLALDFATVSVAQVDGPARARFSAAASLASLRIADLDLTIGDALRATGSAEVDSERLSFAGRIDLDGAQAPGTIAVEASEDGLTVRGPHDLTLELWPGERLQPMEMLSRMMGQEDGEPAPFRVRAHGWPLPELGARAAADVRFAGTVLRPWALLAGLGAGGEADLAEAGLDLSESLLTVRDLPLGGLPNQLDVEFSYRGAALTARRLRFTNAAVDLAGSGVLQVTTQDGLRASGQVVLEAGQERYDALVELARDGLRIDVDAQRVRIDRWDALPIPGTVSGRIQVTGSLRQPLISVELTSYDVPLNEDHVTLALHGSYDGQRVAIHDLAVDYRGHRVRGVAGSIETDTGRVALGGRYEGEYLGQPVALDLGVSGAVSLPLDPLPGVLPVEASLTVAATAVTVGDQRRDPWEAVIRWQDGGVDFEGGPLDGLSGRLSPDGRFQVAVSAPLPLQGTAAGKLTGNRMSAELAIEAMDLTLINSLIHTSAVTVLAGSAAGSVRIHGLINDPEVDGVLEAADVRVASSLIPTPVGPLAFPIVAAGKELTLGPTRSQDGAAPVVVAGSVRFAQWAPLSYGFDVTAAGDGIPVDYRFGPISVDGVALGGLRISGDQEGTHVAGRVEAASADVFIDSAGRGSPLAWEPLTVELVATTGRNVELSWPSEDLPILQALVDVDQAVSISYDGFTGDYAVAGDVAIRRGDLFFFDRTFFLGDGLVSFAEDEGRFDPMVTVRAETRERTPEDGTLHIYLDAESPLSALTPQTVRLSSDPPRPLPQLRAMLGAPFGNGSTSEDVDLLAMAGDMATQFGMVRPMERALRETLQLDLFSIRSRLVQNLLRTPLGATRPDLLDNTTILVGKYLGDDLFLEAQVQVESDAVSPVPELRTNLELSLEWTTPFFLLEWSLLPSLTDPFQTNSALSLTWRFDY